MQARVLIIDDDPIFCGMLEDLLESLGHMVEVRCTRADGLAEARLGGYALVLLDVGLPDGNGLLILPEITALPDNPEVIIITGKGDADGAEMAIRSGAWDYILKTSSLERTTLALRRAIAHHLRPPAQNRLRALDCRDIVGKSPAIRACLDKVAQAAETDFNVLITGQTGTGKELIARAIHGNSSRREKELVVVDCAAFPETVAESILFGHEKGSFTGAQSAHFGLIRRAHGGTLFLDEVGELPMGLQRVFLRVLQEKRFRPVGASQEETSDFRLIAATNKDLVRMAEKDCFRADLLFRLRSLTIHLPSLKERRSDIPEIVLHHLLRLSRMNRMGPKGVSPDFFEALAGHDWPGNVRELVNVLESAFASAMEEPMLLVQHLPEEIRIRWARSHLAENSAAAIFLDGPIAADPERFPSIRTFRKDKDGRYLRELLKTCAGDIQKASRISGLSVSRFYALLKDHGLDTDK